MGVAGTHMAVLTPVAGVGAADAGHAPGERGFANNTEDQAGLSHLPTGHAGSPREEVPGRLGPPPHPHSTAGDGGAWGQRSEMPVLTTGACCSYRRRSRPRRT